MQSPYGMQGMGAQGMGMGMQSPYLMQQSPYMNTGTFR
jgi:hypothetical protein